MSIFGTYQIGQMEPKEAIETTKKAIKTIEIARDEGIQIVWDKTLLHNALTGDRREFISIIEYPMETHENVIQIGRIYVTVNKAQTGEGELERRQVESDVHELLETLNDMLKSKQRQHETTEFYKELDKRIGRKLNESMESAT